MTPLLVTPNQLSGLAAAQEVTATEIDAQAGREREPIALLAPTFGIIGADFLGVLCNLLDARAREIERIAVGHRDLGEATSGARHLYTDADQELDLP